MRGRGKEKKKKRGREGTVDYVVYNDVTIIHCAKLVHTTKHVPID